MVEYPYPTLSHEYMPNRWRAVIRTADNTGLYSKVYFETEREADEHAKKWCEQLRKEKRKNEQQ